MSPAEPHPRSDRLARLGILLKVATAMRNGPAGIHELYLETLSQDTRDPIVASIAGELRFAAGDLNVASGIPSAEGIEQLGKLIAEVRTELERARSGGPRVVDVEDLERLAAVTGVSRHLCTGGPPEAVRREVHELWNMTWEKSGFFAVDRMIWDLYGWLDQLEELHQDRRIHRELRNYMSADDVRLLCSIHETAVAMRGS